MSLKIRLSRVGAKKQASYRIVVADSTAPRDGKAIAILGHYNPLTDPYTLKVDQESAVKWLEHGAQPSETARGLLAKAGVMAALEQSHKATRPKKAEGEAAAETKTRRAARAKRSEAPRLVRPAGAKAAAEGEAKPAKTTTTHKAATTAKKSAAKPAASKTASSKSKSSTSKAGGTAKAKTATKSKASAPKES